MAAGRLLSAAGAVPVLLDGGHLGEAELGAVQPQPDAAVGAQPDPEALRRPVDRDELPGVDLEHAARRGHLDRDLAGAGHDARLPAGADALRGFRTDRDDRGGDLPGAAAIVVP